jgi:hypothetical protein
LIVVGLGGSHNDPTYSLIPVCSLRLCCSCVHRRLSFLEIICDEVNS